MWLWNDRTDFGVSLPLTGPVTKDGTIYNKSLQINYETFMKLAMISKAQNNPGLS